MIATNGIADGTNGITCLPCPFCGGEAKLRQYPYCDIIRCENDGCEVKPSCGMGHDNADCSRTNELIEAWNARAATTLGKVQMEVEPVLHGTLTAEQVREAIERHVKFYDGGDYDEQAIADELNAELGNGTCEWVLEHSGTLFDKWRCSECGYLFVEPRCVQGYNDIDPNFCMKCGKAVKR